MTLQSHHNPYKALSQHVAEVRQGAEAVLARHSEKVADTLRPLVHHAVIHHDLGKACAAFQQYIRDPKRYRAPSETKAHAPLSLFLWLAHAVDAGLDWETVVPVAAAVWQHHGDFPCYDGPQGLPYAVGNAEFTLEKQLEDYPFQLVRRELGVSMPETASLDDVDMRSSKLLDQCSPHDLPEHAAVRFRLLSQLLFSVLLESDRAFLALGGDELASYLDGAARKLPSASIVADFCAAKPSTGLSEEQTKVREAVVQTATAGVNTVTLPTGLGKTLVGAHWLLDNADNGSVPRKCVIVLPYLSIIDQTAKEYRALLGEDSQDAVLEAHSLASRDYVSERQAEYPDDADAEHAERRNRAVDFLADTWHSRIVITTFDQFLASLFSSRGRHQLRSHALADALVVMDEIQAIPPRLWMPLRRALDSLTEDFGARVMVMSATQPGFLQDAVEAVESPEEVFAQRARYSLQLHHGEDQLLDEFCRDCADRAADEWQGRRTMVVLNTRRSARSVRDAVAETAGECPVYFLSADVIPRERLELVAAVGEGTPCIVVATQCIEAGVDIDLEHIIRDIAPMDSIIQVAGRCNRRGRHDRGSVEIVSLRSSNGKRFSDMVYDATLLEKTRLVLSQHERIDEEDVLPLANQYFSLVRESKDLGECVLRKWSRWEDAVDVPALLGKNRRKHEFVVVGEDVPEHGQPGLRNAMQAALETEDRWRRQRELRKLAPRIARLLVSVWERPDFDPLDVAEPLGPWMLLHDGFYEPGRGLDLESATTRESAVQML